jgi:zinc protease
MFADYSWFETYLEKLSAVTAKEIQRVANEYFRPQSRVVGTYIPQDANGAR